MKYQIKLYNSLVQFLCCWVFIMVSGCSHSQFTSLAPNGVILAFGDSLTAGYGTTPENSYPAVLAKLTKRNVINAGISGETTTGGLERFTRTLDEVKPNLLILFEGANDVFQHKDLRQTKQNLNEMIREAKSRNIQILLVALPNNALFPSTLGFYKDLAKENNLVLDDKTIANLMKQPQLKSDYVHFNEKGYHLMAESFYQVLKENNAF